MDINKLMQPPYLYILIGAAVLIVILIVFIIIILCSKKKKETEKKEINEKFDNIISALGGKENIVSSEAKGSRLSVTLCDYSCIDEEKIKSNGVSSIIRMTTKVTLIVGFYSEELSKYIGK